VLRHYATLLRHGRFVAYVLQSGCMSLAFFAIAAASPLLMKDILGKTGTEYGLYFMLFPLGYMSGNWVSSRLSGRVAIDDMVVAGSLLGFLVIAGQAALILAGYLSPLLIFLPGGMVSFAQGLSLPNAQAGAMRVAPALAGTAAGIAVFAQMFLAAVASELYGILADGTPLPMIALTVGGALLALGAAGAAFALGRRVLVVA
jgi:MFS transporter, DHA1 family, multidrug resistance protein